MFYFKIYQFRFYAFFITCYGRATKAGDHVGSFVIIEPVKRTKSLVESLRMGLPTTTITITTTTRFDVYHGGMGDLSVWVRDIIIIIFGTQPFVFFRTLIRSAILVRRSRISPDDESNVLSRVYLFDLFLFLVSTNSKSFYPPFSLLSFIFFPYFFIP